MGVRNSCCLQGELKFLEEIDEGFQIIHVHQAQENTWKPEEHFFYILASRNRARGNLCHKGRGRMWANSCAEEKKILVCDQDLCAFINTKLKWNIVIMRVGKRPFNLAFAII